MRLKNLSIKNMLSYKDVKLDLYDLGLTSVLGQNGFGKSAIFGSVCYALYGKYIVSSDKHLVRDDQNHMEVKLEFEFGDHLIKITRGFRMNKSFAVLRVDG